MLTVLIPAHNEGSKVGQAIPQITETLNSLIGQTVVPNRIVVIADNCTDDTVALAKQQGVGVFETKENVHKKAGGLNQWLDKNLAVCADDELIMVMDADSALNPDFLENALSYNKKGYHAVGGVFLGKEGGGFIGMLQRNEYARYARDVERNNGKTLVLTGTATVFTAKCLKDVVEGRRTGRIPMSGETAQVYDTKALTEDNELTFALQSLGYKIIAPTECGLRTEVMESWGDLWKQRYRWKRGALENNWHYGLSRVTFKHWFLQVWGFIGVLATLVYLYTLVVAFASDSFNLHVLWIGVTLIYVLERAITVAKRGRKQMALAASLVVEMPYDIVLQTVHLYAIATSIIRTRTSW